VNYKSREKDARRVLEVKPRAGAQGVQDKCHIGMTVMPYKAQTLDVAATECVVDLVDSW